MTKFWTISNWKHLHPKINITEKLEFILGRIENWLPAISPFPTVLSKDLYFSHEKTRSC